MEFRDMHGKLHALPEGVVPTWRPSAYGLFVKDGKCLLAKSHKHAFYEIPGGGLEPGETHLDAMRREFREESGYEVKAFDEAPKLIDYNQYGSSSGNFHHTIRMWHLVTDAEKIDETIQDPSSHVTDIEWVDLTIDPQKLHYAHRDGFTAIRDSLE